MGQEMSGPALVSFVGNKFRFSRSALSLCLCVKLLAKHELLLRETYDLHRSMYVTSVTYFVPRLYVSQIAKIRYVIHQQCVLPCVAFRKDFLDMFTISVINIDVLSVDHESFRKNLMFA